MNIPLAFSDCRIKTEACIVWKGGGRGSTFHQFLWLSSTFPFSFLDLVRKNIPTRNTRECQLYSQINRRPASSREDIEFAYCLIWTSIDSAERVNSVGHKWYEGRITFHFQIHDFTTYKCPSLSIFISAGCQCSVSLICILPIFS